jgi:hypothetical protein
MMRYVRNIVACHGVDGIDEMIRFVQTLALGLIAWQRIGSDPIREFEFDTGWSEGKC